MPCWVMTKEEPNIATKIACRSRYLELSVWLTILMEIIGWSATKWYTFGMKVKPNWRSTALPSDLLSLNTSNYTSSVPKPLWFQASTGINPHFWLVSQHRQQKLFDLSSNFRVIVIFLMQNSADWLLMLGISIE